jgi:hypothetical protein
MKSLSRFVLASLLSFFVFAGFAAVGKKEAQRSYYQIKVYRVKTSEQVALVNAYIKDAYIPALHRCGIPKIGAYTFIGNDTAAEKTIYLFVPLRSAAQLQDIEEKLSKDETYLKDGAAYLNAPFNAPAYTRVESILLYAFSAMPAYQAPELKGDPADRIYELRSYESATELLNKRKVHMFNEGGEVTLFKRLGFNAVFYAQVLSGSHMPNLMYMTSFDNRTSRDEHWKTFSADPEWKRLSALPEYKNTVSKLDIILLHPTSYSEL